MILMCLSWLVLGTGATYADVSSSRGTLEATQAAEIAKADVPARASLSAIGAQRLAPGCVSGSSALQQRAASFARRKAQARRVTPESLAGERTVIAHPSTGLLVTRTATVTALGTDSVSIKGFIFEDVTIKAKIDAETGLVTIPTQKIADNAKGEIFICRVDSKSSTYSATDSIAAVATDGDIHINDSFGFFITEGEYRGAYLSIGVLTYTDLATQNASFTQNAISFSGSTMTTSGRSVTTSTDWAYVYQLTDDQIRIANIPLKSGATDMNAILNADGTVTIDPQPMFRSNYYGSFCCYALTENVSGSTISVSASLLSPLTTTYDASTRTLGIGKWMTASSTTNAYSDLIESSSIVLPAGVVFPAATSFALEGEGTEASPYLVRTADDLHMLTLHYKDAQFVGETKTDYDSKTYRTVFAGKYFKLTDDIDFSSFKLSMKPIGDADYRFAGVFDGDGHTIANFTVKDYAYDYLGLFGVIENDGVVKNLKFQAPYLTTLGYSIAAVAGKNFGLVDNCEVSAAKIYATTGYNAAGIVGYNLGTISNSKFTGSGYISSLGYMGGIAGRSYGSITGCSATGRLAMTGKQVFSGGIVGYANGTTGFMTDVKISDCDFTGTLTSTGNETSLGGVAGMVANVTMERCYATPYVSSVSSVSTSLGGLVGSLWQSTISDCYAAGVISDASTAYCGGLVGHSSETSSSTTGAIIKNCYASTIVYTSNPDSLYGIIGADAYNKVTIENCYYDNQLNPVANGEWAKSTAELTSGEPLSGFGTAWTFEKGLYPRLASHADKASAQLSAAPLTLAKGETLQMVKSDFAYSTANDVVWKGVVNGQLSETGGYAYTFSEGVGKLNYKQCTDTIYATKGELSKIYFANIAPMDLKGEGTAQSPWEIGNKDELFMISTLTNDASLDFSGCYFKMVADIDCEGDTIVPICKDGTGKFAFQGTFDGDGHTISNLVVSTVAFYAEGNSAGKPAGEVNPKSDDSYSFGGLFANLGESGAVKNLNIASSCRYDLFSDGGAIAGSSAGLIENCRNYAPVTVYFSKAGGIVGELTKGGIVRGCYNAGHIRTDYQEAGGIAGSATGATIENCANTGLVEATFFNTYRTEGSQLKAGGITGSATSSTIQNVVNSGSVSSYKQVGGIAGYVKGTTASPASMTAAVNYGFVYASDGAGTLGSIVGDNVLGTIANAYYSKGLQQLGAVNNGNFSGVSALAPTALASDTVALTDSVWTLSVNTYPMLAIAKDEPQAKLDAKAVLGLAENNTTSYITKPATLGNTAELTWKLQESKAFAIADGQLTVTVPESGLATDTLTAEAFGASRRIPVASINAYVFDGEGTAQSPFLIKTADDMLLLSSFVETSGFDFEGFNFQVTANLDFLDKTYVPVAGGSNVFRGTFDGSGHTLSHISLTANASDKTVTNRGLFGTLGDGGTIKALTLDSTNVFQAYSYCGAVAASVYGTIENCSSAAAVSTVGGNYAGGIAAYAYPLSRIQNCENLGTVYAEGSYVGGILGASAAGTSVAIDSCSNLGNVTCKTSYAGGIAGSASADILCAVNKGLVQAPTKYAGGILGEALATSSVRKSHNEGTVNANQYTAGIVAFGALHSTEKPFVVDSCYNEGTIDPSVTSKASTSSYAAGIAGELKAGFALSHCYNTADIKPTLVKSQYLAGIVATAAGSAAANSSISYCYNTGNIEPDRYGGGLVGKFSGDSCSVIEFSYNTGDITSENSTSSYIGGICGTGGYYLTDSYNTGAVTGAANYVGGLSGYLTGKAYKYERNFNIGKVSSTGGSKGTQVGGLIGMGRPVMYDCANYGEVSATSQVAGLVGYPGNAAAASYLVQLHRSYNVGKVIASGDSPTVGNIVSNNTSCKYLAIDSCFFDASVCEPTAYDLELQDSVKGLSHAQMIDLDLGSGFVKGTATYPLIAGYEQNLPHSFGIATILLAEGERTDSVASSFKVGTPYGAVWTGTENLVIDGNDVTLNNTESEEDATLTLTVGNFTRTYELHIIRTVTGISSVAHNGEKPVMVKYYTLGGIQVENLNSVNEVVIEKATYADGTTTSRKYVPRH